MVYTLWGGFYKIETVLTLNPVPYLGSRSIHRLKATNSGLQINRKEIKIKTGNLGLWITMVFVSVGSNKKNN